MIPTEGNYAEWFTCAARFHFLREGYAFLSFALNQVPKPGFPVGKLLAAGTRIVGLQFLLPVEAPAAQRVLAYEIGASLHERMSAAGDWLLYALPQSADPLDQQLTHQKVLFTGVDGVEFASERQVALKDACTFKQLVAGLEDGTRGREIPQDYPVAEFVAATREGPATMYVALNRRERIVIALGNQPKPGPFASRQAKREAGA